jgi:hypothetical protein
MSLFSVQLNPISMELNFRGRIIQVSCNNKGFRYSPPQTQAVSWSWEGGQYDLAKEQLGMFVIFRGNYVTGQLAALHVSASSTIPC